MKHSTLSRILSTGSLAFAALALHSQNQVGQQLANLTNATNGLMEVNQCDIIGYTHGCSGTSDFTTCYDSQPWGGSSGSSGEYYYSTPLDNVAPGTSSFTVQITYRFTPPGSITPVNFTGGPWYLEIDGALCLDCSVVESTDQNPTMLNNYFAQQTLTVTHHAGAAFSDALGSHEFALVPSYNGDYNPYACQVRFDAVMIGTSITATLGHFTAPQVPSYILRDPPGDLSYSQLEVGSNYCHGETFSTSDANGMSAFAKIKVGTDVSVGFLEETEVSVGLTAGVSTSREETSSQDKEYRTCVSTTQTYTTAQTGGPESDHFIGAAVRYAYGAYETVDRVGCFTQKSASLGITPTSSSSGFNYTRDDIVNTAIPQTQAAINSLTPGTIPYKQAVNQLDVWSHVLTMDDQLIIDANTDPSPTGYNFSGGGGTTQLSQSITTSTSTTLDMKVVLEDGLNGEFSADVGGNGIDIGGEITMRHEIGNQQSASDESTTTHTIVFGDDDATDHYEVTIFRDRSYGAPVFKALDNSSSTSCPYEGGYQIDQPQLSVTNPGQTTETDVQVPIGGTATFSLLLTNNSTFDRTYYLKVDAASNSNGALLSAFGNTFVGDNGIPLTIAAGTTLSGMLYLNQPIATVTDFTGIRLVLTSCADDQEQIHSDIFVSAYFGDSNTGPYCDGSTLDGPGAWDFISGVQLGSINNTGTGAFDGPSYTDYSGLYSTVLMRSETATLTLTDSPLGGQGDHLAAWIDFDKSGTFDANEKLGEQMMPANVGGQQAQFTFTVPDLAVIGATKLRARCIFIDDGLNSDPIDPCQSTPYYGETEDYGIIIELGTGVDATANTIASLHPNPADDYLQVDLAALGTGDLEVVDLSGRVLQRTHCTTTTALLDVSALANGEYLLRVEHGTAPCTKRFAVVHGR